MLIAVSFPYPLLTLLHSRLAIPQVQLLLFAVLVAFCVASRDLLDSCSTVVDFLRELFFYLGSLYALPLDNKEIVGL